MKGWLNLYDQCTNCARFGLKNHREEPDGIYATAFPGTRIFKTRESADIIAAEVERELKVKRIACPEIEVEA